MYHPNIHTYIRFCTYVHEENEQRTNRQNVKRTEPTYKLTKQTEKQTYKQTDKDSWDSGRVYDGIYF